MKYLTIIVAVFAVLGAGCGGIESRAGAGAGAGTGTGTGIEAGEAEDMSSQPKPAGCLPVPFPCTSHGECCAHFCVNGHCKY